MDLVANDLSVDGQFQDTATFRAAFMRVMAMRKVARSHGRELFCHRNLLNCNPIPGLPMNQAISSFPLKDQRRAALIWLTKAGPFWDDIRQHAVDDYLECRAEIVTDTAVGEAAFRTLRGVDCGLVSFPQSDWEFTPVEVTLRHGMEGLDDRTAAIENWWNDDALKTALRDRAPPIQSWRELGEACPDRFEGLAFAADCFEPLNGIPFAKSSANRFLELLRILDELVHEQGRTGVRTEEGHRIYQAYFTGDRALFSDSSESEKRNFRKELTFAHPEETEGSLFCPWHGKISHQTLRLHFSWPLETGTPVYIVYAGPKITKR